MNDYIEKGMYSPELAECLEQSEVYPLVQELDHVFRLKVIQRTPLKSLTYNNKTDFHFIDGYDESFNNTSGHDTFESEGPTNTVSGVVLPDCFTLSYEGVPDCVVYKFGDIYGMHLPYAIKDRGADVWDRQTIKSRKISQIIKQLTKKEYKPLAFKDSSSESLDSTFINFREMLISFQDESGGQNVYEARNKCADHENKLNSFNNKEARMHINSLIRSHYGDKQPMSHETDTFFQNHVDKSNELYHAEQSLVELAMDEMSKGYMAIGISNLHGYVVGDVNMQPVSDLRDYTNPDNLFKYAMGNTRRVKNIEDLEQYESLKPILTMLKITLESSNSTVKDYFLPLGRREQWIESLGVFHHPNRIDDKRHSPFNISWMLLPKTEEVNV